MAQRLRRARPAARRRRGPANRAIETRRNCRLPPSRAGITHGRRSPACTEPARPSLQELDRYSIPIWERARKKSRRPSAVRTTRATTRGMTCLRIDARELGRARRRLKGAVGGRDEAPREGDSLRLVGVELIGVGAPRGDRGELPAEVHRVADAGVHALTADGAVDVRGVAEQEDPAAPERVGDAVVHLVGREPVDLLDLEADAIDEGAIDVVPREIANASLGADAAAGRCVILDGADEARARLRPRRAGRSRGSRRGRASREAPCSSRRRAPRCRRRRRGARRSHPERPRGSLRARPTGRRRSRRGTSRSAGSIAPPGRRSAAVTPSARCSSETSSTSRSTLDAEPLESRSMRRRSCSSCGNMTMNGYGLSPWPMSPSST